MEKHNETLCIISNLIWQKLLAVFMSMKIEQQILCTHSKIMRYNPRLLKNITFYSFIALNYIILQNRIIAFRIMCTLKYCAYHPNEKVNYIHMFKNPKTKNSIYLCKLSSLYIVHLHIYVTRVLSF